MISHERARNAVTAVDSDTLLAYIRQQETRQDRRERYHVGAVFERDGSFRRIEAKDERTVTYTRLPLGQRTIVLRKSWWEWANLAAEVEDV